MGKRLSRHPQTMDTILRMCGNTVIYHPVVAKTNPRWMPSVEAP